MCFFFVTSVGRFLSRLYERQSNAKKNAYKAQVSNCVFTCPGSLRTANILIETTASESYTKFGLSKVASYMHQITCTHPKHTHTFISILVASVFKLNLIMPQ